MEAYSSLFTSGLRQQQLPRTPERPRPARSNTFPVGDVPMTLLPPPIITTAPSPGGSRPKLHRRRKSSLTVGTSPMALLKSPTRNARTALMSPVREKGRMFGGTSFGSAMNLLKPRRKGNFGQQKPVPTAPLPAIPSENQFMLTVPTSPSRRGSRGASHPPSSPTMPVIESHKPSFSAKPLFGSLKKTTDRVLLRLQVPGRITTGPLSPSYLSNSANVSPTFVNLPTSAMTYPTTPSSDVSGLRTPLSGQTFFDWRVMDDLREEEEDSDVADILMMS